MNNKLALLVNFVGVDKMSGALKNIIGLGRSGSTALRGLNGEARKLQSEMRGVQRELAKGTGNVTALVNKERELERALAGVNQKLERQKRLNAINADRDAIRARAGGLKSVGQDNVFSGATMAAPIILAAKAAMDFSSGMVDIQQKAELTNRETDAMANNILRLAKAAHQLPEDMRLGVDTLAGLGLDPRQAVQMIGPIGRLGTAYKVDLADGANAAFANLNNLKVALGETARANDIMAASGNRGAFEVKDMARWFPALTAQAQALGQKGTGAVADLAAALQVARRATGDSDTAANNVQNLLTKIQAPATIRAFKKNFGVDLPAAMKRAYKEGKTPMEAIAELTKKATGGDLGKLGFAFEDMQAQGALRALIQNLDDYRKIRTEISHSDGTVDNAFAQREARDGTIAWRDFLGTASRLGITLGTTVLPAATRFLGTANSMISRISDWAQANPKLAATLGTVATYLVSARIGLGALQFAFGSLIGPMATAWSWFAKLRVASGVLTALPLLANPVVLAIVAVGAVVAGAAYAIHRYWGPISGFFRQHGTTIRNVFLGMMVIFTPMVAAAVFAASVIYRNWDKIKTATLAMGAAVARVVGPFIRPWLVIQNFLNGLIGRFFMFGVNIVGGLIRGIASMTGSVIKAFLNLAGAIGARFAAALGIKSPSRLFMQMGGHITSGLAMGIDQGGRRPISAVSRMAAGVAAAGSMALPPISAASPSRGGRVANDNAGGNLITINVYGTQGQSVDQLADVVIRKLEHARGVRARSSYGDR